MFSKNPRQTEFEIFEGSIFTQISALASFIRFIDYGEKYEPDPVIHEKILWNHRYHWFFASHFRSRFFCSRCRDLFTRLNSASEFI